MMKRIIIGIIIVVVIAVISLFYVFYKPEPIVDSIYRAVPLDAVFLMDLKDYNSLRDDLEQNELWSELSYFPLFRDINRKLRFADSMLSLNPSVAELFAARKPFLISGHPTGKDGTQLVYYFKVDEKKDFSKVERLIKGYDNAVVSERTYENTSIYDVSFPARNVQNFSYCWSHGVVILSASSILVEDAVRQLSAQESLINNKELAEIMKTSGKSSAVNIYFNARQFPQLAQKIFLSGQKKDLSFLSDLGSWMELDLNIKKDVLMLNGFSIGSTIKPGLLSLFKDQKPVQFKIFNNLPTVAHTFLVLGLDKYLSYQREYSKVAPLSLKNSLGDLEKEYNIGLVSSFNDIFDHEVAIAFTSDPKDSTGQGAWTIIRTKSPDDAGKFITNILSAYSIKSGADVNLFVSKVKVESIEYQIWHLPVLNIPSMLLGRMFQSNSSEYCLLADNYLVFAQNQDLLINYLTQLKSNSVIGNDPEFNKLSDYFSSRSNFFFYSKPSEAMNFYSGYLKESFLSDLNKQQDHLQKIGSIVYQFNYSEQNLLYHNFFVRYSTVSNQAPQPVKQVTSGTNLEGKVVQKPLLVKNPATNETEVLLIDDKNQICLVNKIGRILWKNKLPEPVVSDIFLMDYYKNGKKQFLFNTKSRIYLLDRNGKNVENYPVRLQKPATNGLNLVDYEKNRDYRIFLATDDRNICVFDKSGKSIKEWKPEKTKKEVVTPVQFFRVEGKDYLVYSDTKDLYAVNRKGQKVFTLTNLDLSEKNPVYLINPGSGKKARIVVSDRKGAVCSISLDGKMKTQNFTMAPGNHWFQVCDIDGDHISDYVFTWDRNIVAFNEKNQKVLNITSNAAIIQKPQIFTAAGKCMIGFVSQDHRIYIYNKDKLSKGFPVRGDSQFVADVLDNRENHLYLVVEYNNSLLYKDFDL